jgi:hypothetical protein
MNSPSTASCLLLLAAGLAGQSDTPVPLPGGVVPIRDHGADADSGALGAWAAGDDFKCSFQAGAFVLVPYLGQTAPRNLPWRWRTRSVTAAGRELLETTAGREAHGGTRFSWANGPVQERWDVRENDVAQSWVIASAPAGELVIRGDVQSELHAPARAPRVAPLRFADAEGRVEIEYGTAVAIDARGETVDVPVGYEDGELSLHVPAEFLAGAQFPVTVDPLVSTWVIGNTVIPAGSGIVAQAVERVAATDRMTLVTASTRWASVLDGDLVVEKRRDDFGASLLLYSDLSTTTAAYDVSIATMDHFSSYLVAWSRGPVNGTTAIAWFLADADATSIPFAATIAPPAGFLERSPRLGGRPNVYDSTPTALLVRLRDRDDGTGGTEVWGSTIDCAAGTVGAPFQIAGSGLILVADHAEPSVSRGPKGTGEPWLVAWQTYDLLDRWHVTVRQVRPDGALSSTTFEPALPVGDPHAMAPRIDGTSGRYLLAFTTASTTAFPGQLISPLGTHVRAQRFDWPLYGSNPVPVAAHPSRVVETSLARDLELGGLAVDTVTSSHWLCVHGRQGQPHTATRLGYRGLTLDQEVLPNPPQGQSTQRAAAVAFDRQLERFPLLYGVRQVDNGTTRALLYGAVYEHPAAAVPTNYGPDCGPGWIGYSSRFRIGSELSTVGFINGSGQGAGLAALCALSLGPADVPLAGVGVATSCRLLVDPSAPNWLTGLFCVTDGSGARVVVPLPEGLAPVDLHSQWLVQGTGAVAVVTTPGMRIEIR